MISYQSKVDKPWGYELIFTPPDAPFCGKILHISAGRRLSLQYHDQKSESLCLISGEASLIVGEKKSSLEEIKMEPFKGYFIKTGLVHRILAKTDCDIAEASTAQKGTTVRLEDDSGRGDEILPS